LLPFHKKYSWFLEQTAALMRSWEQGRLKLRVHRQHVLVESMEQLMGVKMEHIHMPLRIEFIDESGIDAGGLEREWFALLSETRRRCLMTTRGSFNVATTTTERIASYPARKPLAWSICCISMGSGA